MSTGSRNKVVVIGSANMDMVVSCSRFPRPGETILGGTFGMYPGGKGANQAVACARLGGNVRFLARLGSDMFRERLIASLESNGVDTTHVITDEDTSTGIALITVDDAGQNEIVVVSGSNMNLTCEDVRRNSDIFSDAAVVTLQLEIPLETVVEAARVAKKAGAKVVLNPAPACELPDELLRNVDVLTPNESETSLLCGFDVDGRDSAEDAARRIVERGVAYVVVTLGADGALVVDRNGCRHYPAFEVSALDTTAAGDAFNGALAFSLANGDTVEHAIVLANAAAAVAVTRMGAQTSMPSLEEVTSFLDSYPNVLIQS